VTMQVLTLLSPKCAHDSRDRRLILGDSPFERAPQD
jgi:hypothetical protein